MKITFRQDLVGSLLFLALSVVLWLLIPSQIAVDDPDGITAQTFPRLIIGLMGLCSLILFAKELLKLARREPAKMVEIQFKQEANAFIVILLLCLYWAMLHWLPFMVSSIVFAFLFLLFFRCKKWQYYAIVAAVIVAVSLLFQNVLNVTLP